MTIAELIAFLPELVILAGSLVLFIFSTGEKRDAAARATSVTMACALVVVCALSLGQTGLLFDGAYRIDAFSQILKLALSLGYLFVLVAGNSLPDIKKDVRSEYFLLLALSVTGLLMLVSCVEIITLVIALELSSFPLFLMVPMRREREGHRNQMEAAAKYIMFGVAAMGVMFFGLSYLFGLTGTLHLPELLTRLQPHLNSPVAIVGLALTFCGMYFKLAVFPFHYWSPDVYQGGANETVTAIASLPKIAVTAVMVRFVSLVTPDHHAIALMLAGVAIASMFYGNLIALVQNDVNRMLGFSAIAHSGYAMIGFVVLGATGFTATLYYMLGYAVMIIACFTVVARVSRDGENVSLESLAGLHRRSPLLAFTLAVGIFGLAGLPPLAGFMGKLMILKAALGEGQLTLVVIAVINSALAIYYYLQIIRETYFKDPATQDPIELSLPTRLLCLTLILLTILLGVVPGPLLDGLSAAIQSTIAAVP